MVVAYSSSTDEAGASRIGVSFKTEVDLGENFLSEVNAFEIAQSTTIDPQDKINIQFDLQGSTQLVSLTIQHDDGEAKTFPDGSWSLEDGFELLQKHLDRISPGVQRATYNRCCIHRSNGCRPNFFGNDRSAGCDSRNEMQRGSTSCGTSTNSRTPSETEGGDDDSPTTNGRKRVRYRSPYSSRIKRESRSGSSGHVVVDPLQMIGITCSDEEALIKFYRRILNDAQQDMSKKIAKWWIKAINPNKQSKYPYARGPGAAPPWWPETPPASALGDVPKGNAENGYVRHVEPDHLSKPERLNLLPHILNLITDPCQLPNLNSVTVAMLEQITNDYINNETTGKHRHGIWRAHLKELFRVAKMQERYRNGEIDGDTMINVHSSYEFLRPKESRNRQREDSKSDGEFEEDVDDDRKLAPSGLQLSPESLYNHNTHSEDRIQHQRLENDVNQGYSGYVRRPCFITRHQQTTGCRALYPHANYTQSQISYQSTYNPSVPSNYQPLTQILQEPIRRHSDIPGPYYMSQTPNLQYQAFPSNIHLSSTSLGPLSPPMPAIMPRPTIDILEPHSFDDSSFSNRTNLGFQNLGRDSLFSRLASSQELPLQPLGYRTDFSFEDDGHHIKQERLHGPATFNLDEMGDGSPGGRP